jgi:hypothetical protein
MRPDLDDIIDMSNADEKRRLLSWLGARTGMYHLIADPKRDTRTLQQNKTWWRLWVQPYHEYLAENEASHPPGKYGRLRAHRRIVAATMGVIEDVNPLTGQLLIDAVPTHDLSTETFADMMDRAAVILAQNDPPIIVTDPDPNWRRSPLTEVRHA